MKESKDIIALVYDNGLFGVQMAQRLAQEYKHVYLHTPWERGFSTINEAVIGAGFADIERCNDIWKVKDDMDLFVFPDICHSGLQLELEQQGFAVWGARHGDAQELNRELFLKTLKKVGLQVPPHTVIQGLTNLRVFLKEKEDCFIKISTYRGSLETTHWRSWSMDKWLMDLWGVKFGPVGDHIPFLVFDKIDTPLEIGGDTYCIDGAWPDYMLHGVEWKDEGYFASVVKRDKMPQPLQDVMEAFSAEFKKVRYRNQFSMEVRIKGDDEAYFIDPTCRGGLPSTGSQLCVWKNFPDIIWNGANGILVQPEPAAKFTAEAILTIKRKKELWGVTEIPDELKPWIKLSLCCEVDGAICFPPDDDGNQVGWLVAMGDTPEETIAAMNEHADALPDGLSANTESLAYVLKEIHEEEKQGIEFSTQPIPEPAIVLD